MPENEWEEFAVGEVSTSPNWTSPDCRPLRIVSHVAHIPTAVRIVEDGRLRAGLIYDKSRLNVNRTQVVWLSPNDWHGAGGFRYGNVRFQYDWEPLVANRNYYWVESIAYGVRACRILITDKDHSKTLPAYDPSTCRGPWWKSPEGAHYWNGTYCLEFMLECDLPLESAKRVDFVDHHAKRCNIDARACPYRERGAGEAGAEFLSILLMRHATLALPGFAEETENGVELSQTLLQAVRWLHAAIKQATPANWGTLRGDDPAAGAVARSLAWYATRSMTEDAGHLLGLFPSLSVAWSSVAQAIAKSTGIPATAFPWFPADDAEQV